MLVLWFLQVFRFACCVGLNPCRLSVPSAVAAVVEDAPNLCDAAMMLMLMLMMLQRYSLMWSLLQDCSSSWHFGFLGQIQKYHLQDISAGHLFIFS